MSYLINWENENALKILNSKAYDFYKHNNLQIDNKLRMKYKGAILAALIDIERVFRGVFTSDLSLKNVDIPLFKKIFPYASELIGINKKEDAIKLGESLERLRNLNAHVYPSNYDYSVFKNDFSFLKRAPIINKNITFFDNEITSAGVIFLLLLFLRDKSIDTLCKKASFFSLVFSNDSIHYDPINFALNISKVNFEAPLRNDNTDDLFTSIFGYYKDFNELDNNAFDIIIGESDYPLLAIEGKLENNKLTIYKDSLSKYMYKETYNLSIEDVEGFIELSNCLPPLTLVDYLAISDIHVFDKNTREKIKNFMPSLSKLNYPKFYVDKNLSIITFTNEKIDYRATSSVLSDCLQTSFLNIEKIIYKNKSKPSANSYSTIFAALCAINTPNDIATDMAILRNFVAHGYILDESVIIEEKIYTFTYYFIFNTLQRFINYLKEYDDALFEVIIQTLNFNLVNKLLNMKFKRIIDFTYELLDNFPNYDARWLKSKNTYINNTTFKENMLHFLIYDFANSYKILRIYFKKINEYIYLYENKMQLLEDFCNKHNYKLEISKKDVIVTDIIIN